MQELPETPIGSARTRLTVTALNGTRGVWMVVSIAFYGLGAILHHTGRILMPASGWKFGRDERR
jgi:hypothetical protein